MDSRQQLVGGGVEGLAAGHDVGAELGEEALQALAGGDREHPGPPRLQPGAPFGHLLAHVRHVEVGDLAGVLEEGDGRLRLVGVDVDLERHLVADHQHRVAQPLQQGHELAPGQALPGDDEVGAVAEAAVLVVGAAEARRLVAGDLGQLGAVPAQPGDDPGEDQHQAVAAGVDDTGLAQHVELFGRPLHRALAVGDRPLQHLGEDRVLLLLGDVAVEPLLVRLQMGELAGDRVGHLAEDGQHRPLGGLAHRVIGGVGGAGEGGGDEHRVDQLAGPAGQLLGGAADDLAEDDARVAARPHQRRAGQRLHQPGAADLVDLEPVEPVQLLHHGAHRHRHVVAGVAVGDREHVEVVDLLAAGLQGGVRGADDPAEALYRGIGHRGGNLAAAGDGWRQMPGAVASVVSNAKLCHLVHRPPQDGDHRLDRGLDRGRHGRGLGRLGLHRRIQASRLRLPGSLRPA